MSRRLSTGVVIWACLCLIVGKSYAWDDPVIYMIPGLTHEPLSYYDVGKEYFYADVISGGPIEEWVWHWPEGAYDIEEYYWPDHSVGLCRFASTGKYWVGATGYTEWLGSDTDWAEVYVFEMDLDIAGVSDGAEYDPGGYIAYNNDDDNENGTPDKDEAGTVRGEDNLVGISLSYEPACLTPGYIELKTPYGGEDIIRVWTDSDKQNLVIPNGSDPYKRWPIGTQPSTLYVEGYGVGTAQLWLLYTLYTPPDTYVYPGGGLYNHDPVKFTVVEVDIALSGLSEPNELSPGKYINVNWDDDDGDGWEPNDTPPNGVYTGDKDDPNIEGGDTDFRSFTISISPSSIKTDVPDTHVSVTFGGNVKVWETTTKLDANGVSSEVSSGALFAITDLTKTLYLEGVSGSDEFRGVNLMATYVPCDANDIVKVTVFEVVDFNGLVTYGDMQHDNDSRPFSETKDSSDKDGKISWDDCKWRWNQGR